MTDDIRSWKKDTCPTLSGKSKLTYHIGTDAKAAVYLRVSENTGGGFFSQEWVALSAIEQALGKDPENITSVALWPLFKGKSVNTPAFLLAVLKHEKVVAPVKGKQRIHQLADLPGFKARVNPGPVKKKATASRRKAG